MQTFSELLRFLHLREYDGALSALYGPDRAERARLRAFRIAEALEREFRPDGAARAGLFSGPGRTELGGNHTDHQRGHVLCGSVDLDLAACAAENGKSVIRVVSEGYPAAEVALNELSPRPEERNTTAALVRGVAAGVAALGYPLRGFDACVSSDVPAGAGLSSSAAFEILIGTILNSLCCDGRLDAAERAKIGQRAENDYFGKPCGLMDQMGCAAGGAVSIDFADPGAPRVKRIDYDFSRSGHTLCIVDTGGSHADLTDEYAAIPREMAAVAGYFGAQALRDVPEAEVRAALPALREACGDRAVLRALHFYDDDRAAQTEAEALAAGDFERFLSLVNASGLSSALRLQNVSSAADPMHQGIPLALALGRELLSGGGAIRVHGGGFAGTVQAFVPEDRLDAFRGGMEAAFGPGACHMLRIRPQGGCMMEPGAGGDAP